MTCLDLKQTEAEPARHSHVPGTQISAQYAIRIVFPNPDLFSCLSHINSRNLCLDQASPFMT